MYPLKHIVFDKTGLLRVFSQNFQKRDHSPLKTILASKIDIEQKKVKEFRKTAGTYSMGNVTIDQIYGGMRDIPAMVCETSLLDPDEGITFRGYSVPQVQEKLPKAEGGKEPLPEGMIWLLLTGDVPTHEQVQGLSKNLAERAKLPAVVTTLLKNFPKSVHPMSQLSAAVCIMNYESTFSKAYNEGVRKDKYWEYAYEDTLNLIAKLPIAAATIYKTCYKDGAPIAAYDPNRDWAFNFCKMLGYDDPSFIEMMRMYLVIHSDHEGGNVSAHATHLVGSSLSDPYLAFAAGLNGLAGPLHGLANQEVLMWLLEMSKAVGDTYTDDNLKDYVWKTLKAGKVIPGYGHAVLRKVDPRFTCQKEFATKHLPDDKMFKLVSDLFNVVPPILTQLGKVKNPWPNVDAHSGVLLQHYGVKETNFYTVLFGVSRAIGALSQLVWSRALSFPIERPKSFTTNALMDVVSERQMKLKLEKIHQPSGDTTRQIIH